MAYSSTALKAMGQRVGDHPIWWAYTSTADAVGTIAGAAFFSDGYRKGVKKYDMCVVAGGDSTNHAVGMFTTVTTSSGATLTVGTLTSTT